MVGPSRSEGGHGARGALQGAATLEALVEAADACGLSEILDGPVGLFMESVGWDDHPAAPILHHLVDQGFADSLREVVESADLQRRWRRRARAAGMAWLLETVRQFLTAELAARADVDRGGDAEGLHPEADGDAARQWAARHGVSDLLELPVGVLLSRVSGRAHHHLGRLPVDARIWHLFMAPTAGPGVQAGEWPPVPFSLKLAVVDWLRQEAADVDAAKAQPNLVALDDTRARSAPMQRWLERLQAARERLASHTSPRMRLEPEDAQWATGLGTVDSDLFTLTPAAGVVPCVPGSAPAIQLRLDAEAPDQAARCACGGDATKCRFTLWAIDSMHAALQHEGSPLVAALEARLGAPRWVRELDLFADLAEEAAGAAPPDGQAAWLVEMPEPGRCTVAAVWTRSYRRKAGLRIWPGRTEGAHPIDDAVFDQLRLLGARGDASSDVRLAVAFRAIELLEGHPEVLFKSADADEPRAVSVTSAVVGLWLGPGDSSDEIRLAVAVDGHPWTESMVRDRLLSGGAGERVAWVADGLRLARIGASARRLLGLVVDRGPRYPADALGTLIDRLPAFEQVLPVHIAPELLGPPVAPRPVLVLELDWRVSVDGRESLFLRLRVRPVPSARPRRPGLGPSRAIGQLDGQSVHCMRDRGDERMLASELLEAFGLPVPAGADARWEFTVPAPQSAFSIISVVDERVAAGASLQVNWKGKRPSIEASTEPDALSLEVRPTGRRGWFRLDGALELDAVELALADLLDQARRGRRFVRLAPGQWARISESLHARLEALAAVCRGTDAVELAGFSGLAVDELEALGVRVDADARWTHLRERVRAAAHTAFAPPASLQCRLRPYQLRGFEWLARLTTWGAGGILADDMGLGKTIQALALLAHRAAQGPALVVAPSSLLFNWRDETRRFVPSLDVRSYRGGSRARQLDGLGAGVVVLATYDIVARDSALLAQTRWSTLVLDEAQAIKNPATQRAQAVFGLPADARVALSGTPIENRLEELWSLFEAVCPGLLGPRAAFREDFVTPIEGDQDHERQAALARIIRPFVLRRLKREVASELPAREMVVRRIPAAPEHAAHYARERRRAVAETRQLLASEAEGAQMKVLAWITRLRMLACHPALVDPGWTRGSAKLDFALQHIQSLVDNHHSVLVFSQFTRHLDLVRDALDEAGVAFVRIDGRTSPARREAAVHTFQAGTVSVFLLSLKAGGVGLNLTAADHVLLLDPWWNPAAEDQAADRAHRIGQQRPVTITRLVTAGTLEDDILALQDDKRALVAATLAGTGAAARLDGAELAALIQGSDTLRADLEAEIPFGHGSRATRLEPGTEAGSESV